MKKNWQQYILEVMRSQRKGLGADILRGTLHAASLGYSCAVSCRNWAFEQKFLKQVSPPVPLIISVGNIVAGGTGKTPVTLMLAQEFYQKTPLAIISRGYRSQAEKKRFPIMLSQGNGPLYSADQCGDEPFLLASRLPKALVVVGKDRLRSAQLAAANGAEAIILDDGMQHRYLARDFDIIVINANDPFGQGYLLPRGLLREKLTSLKRADLIIFNHVHDLPHYQSLKQKLASYSSAATIGTRMEITQVCDQNESPIVLKGKRVGIFCGIANPENFEKVLNELGAIIVAKQFLPDHKGLDASQLRQFSQDSKCKGAECLICTEKDFVKVPPLDQIELPLAYVKMQLKIVEDEQNWRDFISKAKSKLASR
jgi:tetraacyldisaccharide 4'-kinase